jgi:hypothetical protein
LTRRPLWGVTTQKTADTNAAEENAVSHSRGSFAKHHQSSTQGIRSSLGSDTPIFVSSLTFSRCQAARIPDASAATLQPERSALAFFFCCVVTRGHRPHTPVSRAERGNDMNESKQKYEVGTFGFVKFSDENFRRKACVLEKFGEALYVFLESNDGRKLAELVNRADFEPSEDARFDISNRGQKAGTI